MVEVFKTNVIEQDHANMVVERIHEKFSGYKANFDLDDCDKILRIKSLHEIIESSFVIDLLREFGFNAEVLPDDLPLISQIHKHEKIYENIKS